MNLLLGQDLHLFPLQGRELASYRRVGVDQLLLHRLVQGHLADGVAAAHRTIRHIGAPLLHIGLPSALLHLPEELLELCLGQLVQRDLSQAWNQALVDPVLVVELGAWAESGLGVVLIPEVQPVPEGHACLNLDGSHRLAGAFQLLQLGHALLLGFGQHIFCLWFARLVVAHHHPALPAAVLPQADGAFALLSLAWHLLTSP